jgi:hypothetical protein
VAAAAAAGLGVVAALTIGGPVSGSSECATRLACLPTTTAAPAAGNAGEVVPAPTDASGNALPTTTRAPGVFGPAPGLPLITGRGTTTTTGGRATTTSGRGTATTARPPRTSGPGPTSPPPTAPPSSDTTATTAPPSSDTTVTTDTTAPPLPL